MGELILLSVIRYMSMLRWCMVTMVSILPLLAMSQVHPVTFFTKAEAAEVKKSIGIWPLLSQSYNTIKKEVDRYVGTEVDVPVPKDPAGGYSHDKHKANYMLMFNSGILYNLTGDIKYATLVKRMLLKYAALNPTLPKHPQATSSSPGRIFWQALNDANWMVYAGMAYDLVYTSLSAAERQQIETGAFKPEVDYLTKDLKDWFNRLHNHSVWACAGVGIIGIASDNKDYIDMALYGSEKDGRSGFIAQMDKLFSPDGYYTEGPYYVRYAILPYIVFANALHHANPALKIFEHRNRILQKALLTCLQQTNTNGVFFPLNDALKDKDYTTNEIVTAINIAWKVYGADKGLLAIAQKQNRVMLTKGGIGIATELAKNSNRALHYPYTTIESTDGVHGNEGGISILRNGKGDDLTSLIVKYASQGMGHGHFDRLNINLFDRGSEILQDYGSVRFIGIEQKYGGRYLPENEAYAAQTIAHNTLVVDETSHFNGNSDTGEKFHAVKLFSDLRNPAALVVAAKEDNAYKGVRLRRNVYMLQLPGGKKIIADIFNAASAEAHQYDLPFQYSGQFIQASFKYNVHIKKQETLGQKNGYQFLWKEAEAKVNDTTIRFTFLNNRSYYTLSALVQDSAKLFFTRSGANDPNFNLRREPSFVIRKNGSDQLFVNLLEIHGQYDPINEFSTSATPAVQNIKLLRHDTAYTVTAVMVSGKKMLIAQSNQDFGPSTKHALVIEGKTTSWNGPYLVLYDGQRL
jgi:oligo-alginate lyase